MFKYSERTPRKQASWRPLGNDDQSNLGAPPPNKEDEPAPEEGPPQQRERRRRNNGLKRSELTVEHMAGTIESLRYAGPPTTAKFTPQEGCAFASATTAENCRGDCELRPWVSLTEHQREVATCFPARVGGGGQRQAKTESDPVRPRFQRAGPPALFHQDTGMHRFVRERGLSRRLNVL